MMRLLGVLFAAGGWVLAAQAGDWPAWRGPTGQGVSNDQGVPLKWSDKDNVKWKIELAYQGNSTPIIWKDKIFLTQANTGGTVRSLLCFNRADGKLFWQRDVKYPDKERSWTKDWYANASPVTDGQRVVAGFGSAGLYCYDLDGKELWKRTDLGKWDHKFGGGSSPVLYRDLAILYGGPDESGGRNYVVAVNKETGKTVWEHDESYGSWATPLVINVDGQDQLMIEQSKDVKGAPDPKTGYLKGLDLKSGKEIWFCHGVDSYAYGSPLYKDGIAVALSGYQGAALAVKLGGTGDITKDRLWKNPRNAQRIGSGMIVGDHVYIVDENGMPRCYELKTGREVWKVSQRPAGGTTWGSMVSAEGRLYVLMRDGETVVFKASPKYEVLAVNRLSSGEQSNSSPAIADGEIYLRTFRHLWCISTKK